MRAFRKVFERGSRGDSGMTIVEVMFAVAILFFALTAMFGLVATTTTMSVKAKQRAVLINAINSYIEELRAVPYAELGIVGGTITGGTVPASTVMTLEGYTVTLTPTIEWVADAEVSGSAGEDYKKLTLTASAAIDGTNPFTMSTVTYVHDWKQNQPTSYGGGGGGGGGGDPPTIEFVSPTVDADSVVYGNTTVKVHANSAMDEGRLILMTMSGGAFLLQNDLGEQAEWNPDVADATKEIAWKTTATFTDPGTGQVSKLYPDGYTTVRAEVVDRLQQRTSILRRVLIDNFAPDVPPGAPTLDPNVTLTNVGMPLKWVAGQDGQDPAWQYRIYKYRQKMTDAGEVSFWSWEGEQTLQSTAYAHTTEAFGRYVFFIRAESPRGLAGSWVGSTPFVSRPKITGTVTESTSKETHTLTSTPITFKTSAISYKWECSVNGGAWTQVATTGPNLTRTNMNKNDVYAYRLTVSFTPFSYMVAAGSVVSNTTALDNKTDMTFNTDTW